MTAGNTVDIELFFFFLFGCYFSIHRNITIIVRFNNLVLITPCDWWGKEPIFSHLEADKHGWYFILIYFFFDDLWLLTCYINMLISSKLGSVRA